MGNGTHSVAPIRSAVAHGSHAMDQRTGPYPGAHVSRHRRQSGGTKECGHSNPSIPQSEWFLHGAGQGFLSASTTLLAGAGHRSMGAFW